MGVRWSFPPVPDDIQGVHPVWSPPSSENNIEFSIGKYVKEYMSVELPCVVQGYSLSVSTKNKKLILHSGDNVLGVAIRFGTCFKIFRLKPCFEGQQPSGRLKRAGDAPLYFHTHVKRSSKYHSVSRLGVQVIMEIQKGPPNSFEKTCVNSSSGEEQAFWKYSQRQNHVEMFRDGKSSSPDAGLMILLVIVADLLDNDETMDNAFGAAMCA